MKLEILPTRVARGQDVYEKESQQVIVLPYRRPQFQKLGLSVSLSQTATEVTVSLINQIPFCGLFII
jgi:hypothetical protein